MPNGSEDALKRPLPDEVESKGNGSNREIHHGTSSMNLVYLVVLLEKTEQTAQQLLSEIKDYIDCLDKLDAPSERKRSSSYLKMFSFARARSAELLKKCLQNMEALLTYKDLILATQGRMLLLCTPDQSKSILSYIAIRAKVIDRNKKTKVLLQKHLHIR